MRGLTIIVAGPEPARLRTALTLAAAQAALGAMARLFLEGEAVALLVAPDDDGRFAAAGLPSRVELIDEALSLGVRVIACQSGLALTRIDARSLDPRIETGGITGVLASLDDDRLLTV